MTAACHNNRFHQFWFCDRWTTNLCCSTMTYRSVTIADQVNVIIVQRKHFAPTTFFFVTASVYCQSFCAFFSEANVNRLLSVNQMKTASFRNCFQHLSLACIFSRHVFFKPRSWWKKWSIPQLPVVFSVQSDNSIAGLLVLAPSYLALDILLSIRAHDLQLCQCEQCKFWQLICFTR